VPIQEVNRYTDIIFEGEFGNADSELGKGRTTLNRGTDRIILDFYIGASII